eukprot:scaffold22248_cov60-Phaeocystis_antarctica.AAC.2
MFSALYRLRRPIPSWPYRLHGAPTPSALPTHTHPSLPCDTCASAERAKPNVLHVGVERIGKGAALWLTGSCPQILPRDPANFDEAFGSASLGLHAANAVVARVL